MSVPDANSLFQQQRNFVSSLPSMSSGSSNLLSFLSNPGVGTIANVGSSLLGSILNLFGVDSANDASLKAMREQNQWAYKMWKESNEYNSPSAQMARLRAAGINPALAYTNGIQNTANAVSETASPAQQKAFQMPVNPISIDPLAMSQANLINAQAEDARASAKLKESQLPLTEQQVLEIKQNIEESRQRVDESLARINNLEADDRAKEVQSNYYEFLKTQGEKESDAALNALIAAANNNNASAKLSREQANWIVMSAVESLTGIKLDNANKKKTYAKAVVELKNLCVDYLSRKIDLRAAQAQLKKDLHKANVYWDSPILRGFESLTDQIGVCLGGSAAVSKLKKP